MISIFLFQPPERPPKKLHLLKKVSKSTKPGRLAFWEMLFFRSRVALVRFQTSRLDESSCWLLDRLPPTFVRETLWSWTRALPPNQSLLNSFAHSSTRRPLPGVSFTLHSLDPTPGIPTYHAGLLPPVWLSFTTVDISPKGNLHPSPRQPQTRANHFRVTNAPPALGCRAIGQFSAHAFMLAAKIAAFDFARCWCTCTHRARFEFRPKPARRIYRVFGLSCQLLHLHASLNGPLSWSSQELTHPFPYIFLPFASLA